MSKKLLVSKIDETHRLLKLLAFYSYMSLYKLNAKAKHYGFTGDSVKILDEKQDSKGKPVWN
jgi:hypothetical protein